jgi:hypothetical protein
MKKLIFILVTVMLLASAGGGYAYAQTTHQPMFGQKLVGQGMFGKTFEATDIHSGTVGLTVFYLTNPDCMGKITIERISVFATDGDVVYEGPLMVGMTGTPLADNALYPHQTVMVWLPWYILGPTGPSDPRDFPGPTDYTVEISWTGAKGGMPLTGWTWVVTYTYIGLQTGGFEMTGISATSVSQMVNMTQVLTKSK